MGIKSTTTITRTAAIDRITLIYNLVSTQDYRAIEQCSFESEHSVAEWVNSWNTLPDSALLDKYTDSMLEDLMDMPFIRLSMFDNYVIECNNH